MPLCVVVSKGNFTLDPLTLTLWCGSSAPDHPLTLVLVCASRCQPVPVPLTDHWGTVCVWSLWTTAGYPTRHPTTGGHPQTPEQGNTAEVLGLSTLLCQQRAVCGLLIQ